MILMQGTSNKIWKQNAFLLAGSNVTLAHAVELCNTFRIY